MDWSHEETELMNCDAQLAAIIRRNGPQDRYEGGAYFPSLVRSIIGQQVSVKAAAKILERFAAMTSMQPERVATLTEENAKAIGLSARKYAYLRDLAGHFVRDAQVFDHLEGLDDDAVIGELTKIKGIGVWTAQMFLMFTLGRPDIFAQDDRGLQLAVMKLYGLPDTPPREELIAIASKWSPYRTVASWHLWAMLDTTPA